MSNTLGTICQDIYGNDIFPYFNKKLFLKNIE